MNFIDRSAHSLAGKIRSNYPSAASQTLLTYSLSLIINSSLSVLIVLLVSAFTGKVTESLIVICGYTLLRIASGGIHFQSSLVCCLFSAMVFLISSHSQYDYVYLGMLLDAAAILLVVNYAPSGIRDVSTISPKYYPLLKLISAMIISTNFYFHLPMLSTAFFYTSVSDFKSGKKSS